MKAILLSKSILLFLVPVLLVAAVVVFVVAGNGELSWQEQYDLGVSYLSQGRYDEAELAFKAAIKIDPKNPNAYRWLAELYIVQDEPEKALEVLREGVKATGDPDLEDRLKEVESGKFKDYLGNDHVLPDKETEPEPAAKKPSLSSCTAVETYLDAVFPAGSAVKALPFADDGSDERVTLAAETSFRVTTIYRNDTGSYWYAVNGGGYSGYIFSGQVKSYSVPANFGAKLAVGDKLDAWEHDGKGRQLSGTVSSDIKLTAVYGRIMEGNAQADFAQDTAVDRTYSVLGSAIDKGLSLGEIGIGRFGYSVGCRCTVPAATGKNGGTELIDQPSPAVYSQADEFSIYKTVSLQLNGGTLGGSAVEQTPGQPAPTSSPTPFPSSAAVKVYDVAADLPTPTRSGFTFTGWYTALTGGEKVDSEQVLLTKLTDGKLYAHWTEAVPLTGPCGDNAIYTYFGGVMTISGTGPMWDFDGTTVINPWDSYKNDIRTVAVSEGITRVGNNAFMNCANCSSVALPSTLDSIGNVGMSKCTTLRSITLPAGLTRIEDEAFAGSGLTQLNIPASVIDIGFYFLSDCRSLSTLTVDAANPNYMAADSVLFNKTATELLCYPAGKTGTSYTVPSTVTTVGAHAFIGAAVQSVVLPDSVSEISFGAFEGCTSLAQINLPSSLRTISGGAFLNCAFTGVTVPASVTAIGQHALGYTASTPSTTTPVTGFTITGFSGTAAQTYADANGFTFIALDSFTNMQCGDNAYASLDNGTLTISGTGDIWDYSSGSGRTTADRPWHTYRSCVRTLTVGEGITRLGNEAFSHCDSLSSVTLPSTLDSIGEISMDCCFSLQSIALPSGLTSIGSNAFTNSGLTRLDIPASVTVIRDCPASYCSSLSTITVDAANPNYTTVDSVLFNKAMTELICCPMGKAITSYTVPTTVTKLGVNAFTGSSLQSITLPESLLIIDPAALSDCRGLTQIALPSALQFIGEGGFRDCGLTAVTVPISVTTIDSQALGYNSSASGSGTPISGFTISGVAGTAAETYANDNHFTFIAVEPSFTNMQCGPNAYASLANGVMTISGTGDMWNFSTEAINIPWYAYRNSIRSVVIEEGITYLGSASLYECANCTSVSLPSTLRTIGSSSMMSCTSLQSITLPAGLINIGGGAFSGSGLTRLDIPASVSYISGCPAAYCNSLSTITVASANSEYTAVDSVLFNKAMTELILYPAGKSGTSYTVPSTVTMIDVDAFNRATVQSVSLPDTVNYIGSAAFCQCANLTQINIPTSLNTIDYSTFYGCAFTAVTVPPSVSVIQSNALGYTPNPANQVATPIPGFTITGVAGSAAQTYANANGFTFIDSAAFTNIQCGESAYATLSNGVLTISGTGDMYDYSLGRNLPPWYREYRNSITSLVVENGITHIGGDNFYDCVNLTSVSLPNTLLTISESPFSRSGITSLTIPAGVSALSYNPAPDCPNLASITVAAGNTSFTAVNSVLFSSDMTTLYLYPAGKADAAYTIPSTVTGLCGGAFSGARLQSVSLPDSLSGIGGGAFENCTSLSQLTIPANVSSIGSAAFIRCTSLSQLTIPANVLSIGSSAFSGCSSLSQLTISPGVASIGECAFISTALTGVTIPSSVTTIDIYAFGYDNTVLFETIPGFTITGVAGSAAETYANANGFTFVPVVMWTGPTTGAAAAAEPVQCGENVYYTLSGSTLTVSGQGAMWDFTADAPIEGFETLSAAVSEIIVGEGVTGIGQFSFAGFGELHSVTLPDSLTCIGSGAFSNCPKLAELSIPAGVKDIGLGAFNGQVNGYEGSAAQQYARYFDLSFVALDEAAAPEASPTVTAQPSASPEATAQPSASPTATAQPSASPTATTQPSASPAATAQPSASPAVTAQPSASPAATAQPSASPTATTQPSASPTTTAQPSASPTAGAKGGRS